MLQQVVPGFYCECFPRMKGKNHYSVALALIFRQCFYTNNDVASYVLGWMSIILSMISLFPQIIKNFVLKRAAGLSIHLFLIWFVGDVANLTGCILTNQLATQLYLAIYYVCMDIIIISQYTFYEFKQLRKLVSKCFEKLHITKQQRSSCLEPSQPPCREMTTLKESQSSFNMSCQSLTSHNTTTSNPSTPNQFNQFQSHYWSSALTLLLVAQLVLSNLSQYSKAQETPISTTSDIPNCSPPAPDNGIVVFALGTTCSYISCVCYILALIPQVYKNYKRKSVQGLSVSHALDTLHFYMTTMLMHHGF